MRVFLTMNMCSFKQFLWSGQPTRRRARSRGNGCPSALREEQGVGVPETLAGRGERKGGCYGRAWSVSVRYTTMNKAIAITIRAPSLV